MATRTTFNGASTGVPWKNVAMPEGFGDQYARHVKTLYDAACLPLTDVGGTADDVTATLEPELDGDGLVDGMRFTLTWDTSNTGPMTLAINGGSPVDVLDAGGSALIAGAVSSGLRSLIEFVGGDFRLLNAASSTNAGAAYYLAITSSATWTKPAGYADDVMFLVEAWGGGGGGGVAAGAGGGGGGGYASRLIRWADLPSTVTVTIGAGGSVLAAGGNTTFGVLVTAYAGGTCSNHTGVSNGNGGGGGGMFGAGGNGSVGVGGVGGAGGGGQGWPTSNPNPASPWGGGGGGMEGGNPGWSVYGGGGGVGWSGSVAGLSARGGRGGYHGEAGQAPGGGGGWAGAGARGEVRITRL